MNISNFIYCITPFFTWLVTGFIKFIVTTIKTKKFSWQHIGYGGMPSNHAAIVSSMVVLIALSKGVAHPAFGVALTLAFIVIMDAKSLRRQIGKQAQVLNQLQTWQQENPTLLRERIGHHPSELVFGMLTGACCAWLINTLAAIL